MPHFTIRAGFTLRDSDDSLKTGGDTIELDTAMAEFHRDKLDPVQVPATPTPAPDADTEQTT